MATEFELNGHEYRVTDLNTFAQLHLSRKIAPVLVPMVPAFMEMDSNNVELSRTMELLEPVTEQLAEMEDEKVESIMRTALSAVQRRQEDRWSNIWSNDALMFQDIDLSTALQLVFYVVQDQLGSFIQGFLSTQEEAQEPETATTDG